MSATVEGADEDRSLEALVRASPLSLFVLRLPDSHITEVSDSMAELSGWGRAKLLTMKLTDFVQDPETVQQSLMLLAAGKVDGYNRRGAFHGPSGDVRSVIIRVDGFVDQCPRTRALAMILDSAQGPAVLKDRGDELPTVVLGTVDSSWNIDRITSDVGNLLDDDPRELLGRSAFASVHPEDIGQLLLVASEATARHGGATGRLRLRLRAGHEDWIQCRVSIMPLAAATPGGYAFAVSPIGADAAPEQPSRARELEEHLRRIAREVSASGVAAMTSDMPTALEVPELSTLTSREYEIVVRLASGERVQSIARRLFLSESTVRNHLTAVYRKFGVTSQAELIARLHQRPT